MSRDIRMQLEIVRRLMERQASSQPHYKPVVLKSDGSLYETEGEMYPLCKWKGCRAWGNQRVLLKIYPIGDRSRYSSLEFGESQYCDKHVAIVDLKEIVDEEGWETIRNSFIRAGLFEPDRETVEIYCREMFKDGGLH